MTDQAYYSGREPHQIGGGPTVKPGPSLGGVPVTPPGPALDPGPTVAPGPSVEGGPTVAPPPTMTLTPSNGGQWSVDGGTPMNSATALGAAQGWMQPQQMPQATPSPVSATPAPAPSLTPSGAIPMGGGQSVGVGSLGMMG